MNAKPGREGVELAIYGMDGVPKEMIAERAARKKDSSSEEEETDDEAEDSPPPPPPPPQQPQQQQQVPGYPPQFPGYQQFPGMGMRPLMPGGMPPQYPGMPPH